ncbi:MAG TPA: toxin-antitoxin system HicB family antitoxin [Micromonosporaceae bacterium]|nr:toxin-antitoxin system HicB family antitoxin [Micromonosporaceae bacterium]
MDLTPYLESLRRDLAAAAAPGGPEIAQAAELLTGSLDASVRLSLMEALADAAAELTTKLATASVEVRLRGREAELVVTEVKPAGPAPPPPTAADSGELARVTLRLPESLKEAVERAAAGEGISVNSWLVRAIAAAAMPGSHLPPPAGRAFGRRVTGFAQA